MPILRKATKDIRVTNDATTKGKHESELLFAHLLLEARESTSFEEFSHSLISVTKTGATVHSKEDVLITYKGEAILIGRRGRQGRYHIPLVQHKG